MTRTQRRLMAALSGLSLGAGLLVTAAPAQAAVPEITMNSVGSRFVHQAIPVVGFVSGTGFQADKNIYLQRRLNNGTWKVVDRKFHQTDGRFTFPDRHVTKPQTARWRALVKRNGKLLDTSNTLRVLVKAGSPPPPPPPPPPPSDPLLPNLVIQNLTICSAEERAATGTCFRVRTDPVTGKRQLKFPVLTANVGVGPMEIHGTRSSTTDQTWSAIQTIFHKDGSTSNLALPGMNFRFGTDGHTHWHIIDFDSYRLLNTDGSGTIAVGEKHDYCVDDNSTPHGGPIPGMPVDPVYTEQISCGDGNPDATSILDGMSVGWGDTYPSSLPNQAIDITGLADGTYTVKVCADTFGLLQETNEGDNCAQVNVAIAGDTASPIPGTDTGF